MQIQFSLSLTLSNECFCIYVFIFTLPKGKLVKISLFPTSLTIQTHKRKLDILSIHAKEWRRNTKIVYISNEKIYFLFFVANERKGKYYAIISKNEEEMKRWSEGETFIRLLLFAT